jgi:hypothetical protein
MATTKRQPTASTQLRDIRKGDVFRVGSFGCHGQWLTATDDARPTSQGYVRVETEQPTNTEAGSALGFSAHITAHGTIKVEVQR